MVKRYYGGIISATPPVVNTFGAPGVFNTNQHLQAVYASNWPTGYFGPNTVDYLVVAGGGSGAGGAGGGGGGGYRTATGFSITPGTPITVTVGAGGTRSTSGWDQPGTSGGSSAFGTIVSAGGGHGGSGSRAAGSGGSGGGGGWGAGSTFPANLIPGGTASPSGQGNAGGTGGTYGGVFPSGGGGGAGAPGQSAITNTTSGNGGDGLQSSISGTATYYAGGGAGANNNGAGGTGGLGGGGNGGGDGTGQAGTQNTGGGGGGGNFSTSGYIGGSGIVIIRYPDVYAAATTTTGSPTVTVEGGYRIYKWTSSGSITF